MNCTCKNLDEWAICPHAMTTGYAPCNWLHRQNAAEQQMNAVRRMLSTNDAVRAAHEAIEKAAANIWYFMKNYGGCPNATACIAERMYWIDRQGVMKKTLFEAGYRIWRSIQERDGDPTHDSTIFRLR